MNDTQFVKMLADVNGNLKNETYELDTPTAQNYIKAGLASAVENKTDALVADLKKTFDERDENLIKTINEAMAKGARAPAIPKSDPHADWSKGEFYCTIAKASCTSNHAERESAQNLLDNKYKVGRVAPDGQKTNMSQGTSGQGGYLVPQIWADSLFEADGYDNPIYERCTKYPIENASAINIPTGDYTVTPSATGQTTFANGVTIGIVSENSAPSLTLPLFKNVTLTPKSLVAATQASNLLINNSPISVAAIIENKFKEAANFYIEHQSLNGAGGSSALHGILGDTATYVQPRNTSAHFKLVDAAAMYSRLMPRSRKNAVWLFHPLNLADLMTLSSTLGALAWLPQQSAIGVPTMTLFGLPVYASEALPSPSGSSSGDVLLVDPSMYLMGISKQVSVEASRDFAFTSNATVFRVTAYIDAAPAMLSTVLLNDTTTQVAYAVELSHLTS